MKTAECLETLFEERTISVPEGFKYKIHLVDEISRWDLMPRVRPLHEKLGLKPSRTEKEVFYNLKIGTEVGIMTKLPEDPEDESQEPEDVAFVAQSLEEFVVNGKKMRVLSIAAKVVAPDYQNHLFGTIMAQEAITRLHPDAVTGRTPNPNAIRAYEKTGFIDEIYPIDRLYPWNVQTYVAVMFGREVIEQDKITLRTGRCEGVYPPGVNRTFDPNSMSEKVSRIYNAMVNPPVNADLENGDGVKYWATVNRIIYACPPEKMAVAA